MQNRKDKRKESEAKKGIPDNTAATGSVDAKKAAENLGKKGTHGKDDKKKGRRK